MKAIVVKQDEDSPVPIEVLAKAILSMSQGFERAASAGLTKRALSLLIMDMMPVSTRPSRKQVEMVLDALPMLAANYLSAKVRRSK